MAEFTGESRMYHGVAQGTQAQFVESQDQRNVATRRHPLCCSKRLLILILMFLRCFLSVLVTCSIHIAFIELSNLSFKVGVTELQIPSYEIITFTYHFGFLFSPIGGYLATKFGGSVTYGFTSMLASMLTALNPATLQWNVYIFSACRIAAGLFDGFAYASIAEIFTRWVPAKERSTSLAIVLTGFYIGNTFFYIIPAYIASSWGWQTAFYATGAITFVWSVVWLIIARNEPSEDKTISQRELQYIQSQTDATPRHQVVHPILKILTSLPVWAMCIGEFASSWGYDLIASSLPIYFRDATGRSMTQISTISVMPILVSICITPILGVIMDLMPNYIKLEVSQIHKIAITFGFSTSCILFAIAFFSNNIMLSITCLLVIKLLLSFNLFVLQVVCLYLAPKHSSILLGFSAIWPIGSKFVVPFFLQFIVKQFILQEWQLCFLLSSGALLFGTFVYWKFGSSQLQPWATSHPHRTYERELQ
ncbi:vesicular glutamate transporter 1-like [Planococcus citri]|uniref:vesicular glutamate transporter 1-like n=1 Tax=Planococcus citri TaxID=170843 RepID=UPI0031F7889C